MFKQKEVLEKTGIKERLLRFWIKEYKLKKYVKSRKTGNLYDENIIFYLNTIKALKDRDVFTTDAIKKIIDNIKKNNTDLFSMEFILEEKNYLYSNMKTYHDNYQTDDEKIIEKRDEEEQIDYFECILKAESLISENKVFDALNMLTLVKNNSNEFNAIASEMIKMIENKGDKNE